MENKKTGTGTITTMSEKTKISLNPYNDVAVFRDGFFHFSLPSCFVWLEKTGKVIFGEHFKIYPEDRGLIGTLLVYAIGDESGCAQKGISLRKGILLSGPVGCGKSSLMTLINYFFPTEKQYQVKACREISFELEKQGYSLINRYSKGSVRTLERRVIPQIWCFDDLGVDQPQKYFGTECEVMAEILLSRYDQYIVGGVLTHATTNLSASELEIRYGNRVRSRMREMFNLVAFDRNARDKRI